MAIAKSTTGSTCARWWTRSRPARLIAWAAHSHLDVTDATVLQRAIAAARASRLGHHPESFIYASESRFRAGQERGGGLPTIRLRQSGLLRRVDLTLTRTVSSTTAATKRACAVTSHRTLRSSTSPQQSAWPVSPDGPLRQGPRAILAKASGDVGLGCTGSPPYLCCTSSWAASSPPLFPRLAIRVFRRPWPVHCGGRGIFDRDCRLHGNLAILPWLPLVFVIIHLGAGIGLLTEAVCPKTDGRDVRDERN